MDYIEALQDMSVEEIGAVIEVIQKSQKFMPVRTSDDRAPAVDPHGSAILIQPAVLHTVHYLFSRRAFPDIFRYLRIIRMINNLLQCRRSILPV